MWVGLRVKKWIIIIMVFDIKDIYLPHRISLSNVYVIILSYLYFIIFTRFQVIIEWFFLFFNFDFNFNYIGEIKAWNISDQIRSDHINNSFNRLFFFSKCFPPFISIWFVSDLIYVCLCMFSSPNSCLY